jgi:hypothetical protein
MALAHAAGVKARMNKLTLFTQIDPDDLRRPDLLLGGMGPSGQDLVIDLTVGHPSLATHVRQASKKKRSTCITMAEKKRAKYREKCEELGLWFLPVTFEAFGSTTDDVVKLIRALVEKAVYISGYDFSQTYNYWKKRLATTLQRETAKFVSRASHSILSSRSINTDMHVPHTTYVMSEHVHNNL